MVQNQNQIKQTDVVLFDQDSRPEFGPIVSEFLANRPVETEIAGRRIRVGGLFSLGASFGAWLTDQSFPLIPQPLLPQEEKGTGQRCFLKAPLPERERGWGEGGLSFVSQSALEQMAT
jgi:hypothetical protein